MTDATELEDLETLIACPGWKRVESKFVEQWGRAGTRYLDLLEKMANSADRVQVADEIQRVIWVRKEIELFFRSIESRAQELRSRKAPPPAGRRGVL
jgi:hypothetical protein